MPVTVPLKVLIVPSNDVERLEEVTTKWTVRGEPEETLTVMGMVIELAEQVGADSASVSPPFPAKSSVGLVEESEKFVRLYW